MTPASSISLPLSLSLPFFKLPLPFEICSNTTVSNIRSHHHYQAPTKIMFPSPIVESYSRPLERPRIITTNSHVPGPYPVAVSDGDAENAIASHHTITNTENSRNKDKEQVSGWKKWKSPLCVLVGMAVGFGIGIAVILEAKSSHKNASSQSGGRQSQI
jgi:hypothetical protein